ncbi:MAG: MFS transporter [Deltaproteobacteria bacterium]|nr:MFS transporter [Deltaproteobacteria bacterium]
MPREPLITRPFLLAFAAHFLHALASSLFLHLPGFLKHLGATEVAIGLIFGAGTAVAVIARPTMGAVMDRRGIRPIILIGGLLHATACALYLTVGTLGPWLVVVRIIHGAAGAAIFVSVFAFAASIVPASRRFEGIALFGVSGMLPMSFGGLLGDLILAHAAYQVLFVVSAGLATVALLLSLPLRDAGARPPEPAASGSWLGAARAAGLLPIWMVAMVFGAAVAAPFTFLKTFVMTTGVGSVGLFFTVYSLAAVALRLAAGSLPDRVGPKRVLLPALLAGALGLGVLAHTHTVTEMTTAGLLCGLSHGFAFPILVGLLVTRAPAASRSAAYAIFTALWDVGAMVGAPLFGLIVQHTGYPAMFATAAGLVLCGTTCFAAWDRRRGAGRPAPPSSTSAASRSNDGG